VPEGDTIFRAATTMRRALAGRTLIRVGGSVDSVAAAQPTLEGRRIDDVTAAGKHLLVRFDDGRTLRTHMRMIGSWHLYRPGEPWQKPERGARVVLETPERVAVCFHAPEVELLAAGAVARSAVGGLGPDLIAEDTDPADVAARWRARPELPIGVAVMRQRLAAGIGNVYKSEALFLCGVDPFRRVRDLPDAALLEVARTARRLMLANLDNPGPRATRRGAPGRLWVYGRSGRRCYRCATTICMRRQGPDGRSTYYCERCQS
jgi:endonuclease-8